MTDRIHYSEEFTDPLGVRSKRGNNNCDMASYGAPACGQTGTRASLTAGRKSSAHGDNSARRPRSLLD